MVCRMERAVDARWVRIHRLGSTRHRCVDRNEDTSESAVMNTEPDILKKICRIDMNNRGHGRLLRRHLAKGRVASATTIAVGDESPRNPRIAAIANEPRSGSTRRAKSHVVPLRSKSIPSSRPWVPRRLVTHDDCRFGATRQRKCGSPLRGLHLFHAADADDVQHVHPLARIVGFVEEKNPGGLRHPQEIGMIHCQSSPVGQTDYEWREGNGVKAFADFLEHELNLHAPSAASRSLFR